MSLYTVILEYAGGTYISQVPGSDEVSALSHWKERLDDDELTKWKLNRQDVQQVLNESPVQLTKLLNIWCSGASASHGLILVNLIKTDPTP